MATSNVRARLVARTLLFSILAEKYFRRHLNDAPEEAGKLIVSRAVYRGYRKRRKSFSFCERVYGGIRRGHIYILAGRTSFETTISAERDRRAEGRLLASQSGSSKSKLPRLHFPNLWPVMFVANGGRAFVRR